MAKSIIIQLIGDSRRFREDMNQADGSLRSFAGNAAKYGAAASTAIVGALGVIGKKAIDVASDTSEAMSKTSAVFGKSSAAVTDFASTSAKAYGLSKREALTYVSSLGAVAVASGLTQDKATALSLTYTKLAADLGSFYNTSAEDAAHALQSSMTGEFEELKKYGIVINDARLAEEARNEGLKKSGATWTIAQKQALAYQIVMKDTAVAQGDFERTSGGLANSTKIFKAQVEDLQGALGAKLLPIVTKAVGALSDLATWLQQNPKFAKAAAVAIGVLTVGTLGLTAAMWALSLTPVALTVFGIVAAVAALAAGFAFAWQTSEQFRDIVVRTYNVIKDVAVSAVQGIVTAHLQSARLILVIAQKLASGWAKLPKILGGGIAANIAGEIQGYIDGLDRLQGKVNSLADSARAADWALRSMVDADGAFASSNALGSKDFNAQLAADLAGKARPGEATAPGLSPADLIGSAFSGGGADKAVKKAAKKAVAKVKPAAIKVGKAWVDGIKVGIDHTATTVKDALQGVLGAAKDRLQAARDMVAQIKADMFTLDVRNDDPMGLVASLRKQAEQMTKFVAKIKELRKKGYAEALVRGLVDRGPAALADATELSHVSKRDVNALYDQTQSLGDTFARSETARRTGTDLNKDKPVKVTFDIKGSDKDLVNLIKKWVQREGGGDVQVAFGK